MSIRRSPGSPGPRPLPVSHGGTGGDTPARARTKLGVDATGTASAAVAAHVAGVDPHPTYQKEGEKDANSGYAGLDTDGRVPANHSYILSLIAGGLCGDGSDGAVDFNGTNTYPSLATTTGVAPNLGYTLIKDVHATDCDVRATIGVRTAGFVIRCTGRMRRRGHLYNDGVSATNESGAANIASEGTIGAARAGGGNGATATAGQTVNGTNGGGSGGRNVAGSASGAGGAASTATGGTGSSSAAPTAIQGGLNSTAFSSRFRLVDGTTANTSAGGGGGGAKGNTGTAKGGGGGQCGGALVIVAKLYDGDTGDSLSCVGGNGFQGTGTGDGQGGGGGGGAGGWIYLHIGHVEAEGQVSVAGGTGGNGFGGGAVGNNGTSGRVFRHYGSQAA